MATHEAEQIGIVEAADDWFGGEPWPRDSGHPRPLKKSFYVDLRARVKASSPALTERLESLGGRAIDLKAGDALTLRLLEGAQIINLWAFNTHDPDERLWVQDMCLIEGVFLTRYSRLWGEMPRYRPLLAMIEDTVCASRTGTPGGGQHHFLFGGGGKPTIWRNGGGAEGVKTTYEQFVEQLDARGIPRHLLTDNVCLFQKTALDPATQRFVILPSDAVAGDEVTLFAEIDVTVLLAISPYVDGARTPAELGTPIPRPVAVEVFEQVATPLGWPYPGMPYPNLSLYVDEGGQRSDTAEPTDASAYTRTPKGA